MAAVSSVSDQCAYILSKEENRKIPQLITIVEKIKEFLRGGVNLGSAQKAIFQSLTKAYKDPLDPNNDILFLFRVSVDELNQKILASLERIRDSHLGVEVEGGRVVDVKGELNVLFQDAGTLVGLVNAEESKRKWHNDAIAAHVSAIMRFS